MEARDFRKLLESQWARDNFGCVGLDSEFAKLPKSMLLHMGDGSGLDVRNTLVKFNRAIVEATSDVAGAFKLNVAFYEACGADGFAALRQTINDIHTIAPDVPVILDAKRADIDNTNTSYASAAFDYFRADAITVNPYFGGEALKPFFARREKGIFVVCRTSNPGAGEFQDSFVNGEPLYRFVARRATSLWNKNGNCALVVGATYPDELREVRELVGDMPILIPGIGAQGGNLEKIVLAGKDSRGMGLVISSSRRIIFASSGVDFAEAARRRTEELRSAINQCRC